jgi:hypothetical protein
VSAEAPPIGLYQLVGFGLFGALPAVALLLVASRFGHRVRMLRFRALRAVGVSRRSAQSILGVELAVPVALGALAGVFVPRLLAPETISLPLVDRLVYTADARLGPLQSVAVVLITGLAAFGAGAGAVDRPRHGLQVIVRLGLVVFGVGAALAATAWVNPRPNDPARTAAVVLLAAGLPGACETLASAVAAAASRVDLGPIWLVATRSVRIDPRSAGGVAGLAAAGVFAVAVAAPVAAATTEASPRWTTVAREAGDRSMLVRSDALDGSPFPIDHVPPTLLPVAGLWSPGSSPPAPPVATALVASCAQIQQIIDPSVRGCSGTPQRVAGAGIAEEPELLLFDETGTASALLAPFSGPEIELAADDSLGFRPAVVIPPGAARPQGGEPYITNLYGRSRTDLSSFDDVQASVIGRVPSFRVESSYTAVYQPDSTAAWITLGQLVVVLTVLFAGLLSAASGRAVKLKAAPLLVAGFGRREVDRIRILAVLICSLAGASLAAGAALVVISGYGRVNGEDLVSGSALALLVLLGVVVPVATEVVFDRFVRRP